MNSEGKEKLGIKKSVCVLAGEIKRRDMKHAGDAEAKMP